MGVGNFFKGETTQGEMSQKLGKRNIQGGGEGAIIEVTVDPREWIE